MTASAAAPAAESPLSAGDSVVTYQRNAAARPLVAPLTLLGSAHAEVCVDGVCEVPTAD
ncbi:MAG: hypothetical protein JWP66_1990 [Naasia sp.]|nr:hypothetical protein [Naasia sp.]